MSAPSTQSSPDDAERESRDSDLCVLDALHDEDCRSILESVSHRPMTATELSEVCDIPLSTTYRKLDLLTSSRLLVEGTRVATGGKHATQYERGVDEVSVQVTPEGVLDVSTGDESSRTQR